MENSFLKCGEINLVGMGAIMLARSVTMYLNRGVKDSGLTINQIYILFLVDKCRGEHMGSIAQKGVMARTTLTRLLSGVKEYVLIHRNADIDLRYSYPALTKKGADFLEKWMPRVLELEQGLEIAAGDTESFIRFVDFFSSELKDLNSKQEIEA